MKTIETIKNLPSLTDEERNIILPKLVLLFKTKTNENKTLYSTEIVRIMNNYKEKIGFKSTFTEARLRKLVNYIRCTQILAIASGQNGYYMIKNKEDLIRQAIEMESRAQSILAAAQGLRNLALEIKMNEDKEKDIDLFDLL